jgi:hypothetical protein
MQGWGLAGIGFFFMYLPIAFIAPVFLGAIWLIGYRAWRGRRKAMGITAGWPMSKALVYLALAVLTAYVLTFTACNGVLPGLRTSG